MKCNRVRFLGLMSLVAMGALTLVSDDVYAQSMRFSIKIPFDFYVGNQNMPAGWYEVRPLSAGSVLQFFERDGKHVSSVMTMGTSTRNNPVKNTIVFNRYGDQFFLSEVHWRGSLSGRTLTKASREIEMARNSTFKRVTATGDEKP
jgi:hypothetical protein